MARVNKEFLFQFPSCDIQDLNDPIIFVVDMIQGFINEGALHDTCINTATKPIQTLIENCNCRTIFIADAHPPKAREFSSFPPHCVIGTKESEVIDELQPYIHELFHKNSTNAFHCQGFQEFLNRIDMYEDIIITGCCSDICIMQFALSLQSWLNEHSCMKQRIIIPMDTIETYHINDIHDAIKENEFSIRNMAASGIHIVRTIERGNSHG